MPDAGIRSSAYFLRVSFVEALPRRQLRQTFIRCVFGAAAELSQSHSASELAYPSSGEIAASAAGQQMATLGSETTRRNLNVQLTIKIPQGYRFSVRLNRDLALEDPYWPPPTDPPDLLSHNADRQVPVANRCKYTITALVFI